MKRLRGVFGLIALGFGAFGSVKELRAAQGKRDKLALANAVVNIAAVITGAALTIRGLRRGDEEE